MFGGGCRSPDDPAVPPPLAAHYITSPPGPAHIWELLIAVNRTNHLRFNATHTRPHPWCPQEGTATPVAPLPPRREDLCPAAPPRDVPQTPAVNPKSSFTAQVRVQLGDVRGHGAKAWGHGAADALRAFPAPVPEPAAFDTCCSPVCWLPAFDATLRRLSDVHRLHVSAEQSLFQRNHLKAYAGTKLKGLLIRVRHG